MEHKYKIGTVGLWHIGNYISNYGYVVEGVVTSEEKTTCVTPQYKIEVLSECKYKGLIVTVDEDDLVEELDSHENVRAVYEDVKDENIKQSVFTCDIDDMKTRIDDICTTTNSLLGKITVSNNNISSNTDDLVEETKKVKKLAKLSLLSRFWI